MGKQKIGKLYLHWSKRGIAYKWGDDGEIHRFSFGQPTQTSNSRTYYDNSAQDDQPYDDRYPAGGYDAYGAPYYEEPSRLAITWEHPWLFWLLLIICPPLGIYALWKRNQFDSLVQAAISGLSLIWFIVLLIWLFSGIFGSKGDPTSPINQLNVATLTQTVAPTESALNIPLASPTPLPDDGNKSTDSLLADLAIAGTAAPGEDTGTVENPPADDSSYVFTAPSGSGAYYHRVEACNGTTYSNRITLGYAKSLNLTQCPQCYTTTDTGEAAPETTTYYATSGGKHYHTDQTCGGMKNAKPITAEQALKDGKTECPTCMTAYYMTSKGTYYHKSANCTGMTGAQKVGLTEALASKKPPCPVCITSSSSSGDTTTGTYYSTKGGSHYHKAANCSGMKNAERVTLAVAKERNQTACPTCIGSSSSSTASTQTGTKYYATKTGEYYHIKSTCSGMKNATSMSLTAARKADKDPCPVCLKVTSSGTYYATKDGDHYHSDSTCSGMKNASKISLATAQKYGKTACPTCLSVPATYVYMTNSGKYYHSKSSCGGQSGSKRVAISTAKNAGKTACPVCIGGKSPTPSPTTAPGESVARTDANTYCYASEGNKYYHKVSDCSGMTNAKKMTIRDAKERGKSICPICKANYPLPTAEPTVYGTPGNKYYHKKASCSGMSNATKLSLSSAKSKNLSACPVCVQGTESGSGLTLKTIEPTCYVSSSDDYYHAKRSCPLTSSASKTTLSKAKSKGKSACPYCAGSSLDKMVFASSEGQLYHSKSTCNGVQMNIKACLSEAVNKGYKPCSRCSPPKSTKRPNLPEQPQVVTPAPTDNTVE